MDVIGKLKEGVNVEEVAVNGVIVGGVTVGGAVVEKLNVELGVVVDGGGWKGAKAAVGRGCGLERFILGAVAWEIVICENVVGDDVD